MTDKEFLNWLVDRLVHVYGESPNVDFVHKLKAIAETEQEPVAMVVATAPTRIWLDLGFDPSEEDEISFHDLVDATWSDDNATGHCIEYVRADTSPPQRQPLTDKQLNIIGSRWHLNLLGKDEKSELFAFARAIEAAHGIKGEA